MTFFLASKADHSFKVPRDDHRFAARFFGAQCDALAAHGAIQHAMLIGLSPTQVARVLFAARITATTAG